MLRNWKSICDAIRSTPGASMIELGRMSIEPASVRDRLSPTRERKLWWKVCLHPHLKQGGMPPVERRHSCRCCFFLSYAAAAQLPQSCLIPCNPIDSSPPGSSVPGTLQERILEWVAISFSSACMISCVSHVQLCATLWTAAHQAALSTGFSRQEYWSGLPFPSPKIYWIWK